MLVILFTASVVYLLTQALSVNQLILPCLGAKMSQDTVNQVDQWMDTHSQLWGKMLAHPFLEEMRRGEIGEDVFNRWLRQDYIFVEAAIPFVGALIARCPEPEMRKVLGNIPGALEKELQLFRERATHLGVDVGDVQPGFINHAYVQYLMAVGHQASFEEGMVVYWAAEKAYHESWKKVAPAIEQGHPWRPFVENWAGDEFGQLVN